MMAIWPWTEQVITFAYMLDKHLTQAWIDGIFALGPDTLSIYNNPEKKVIPTFVTTMFEEGIIDNNVFSVYFQPLAHNVREQKRINGEIVFGGGKFWCCCWAQRSVFIWFY